MAMLTRLVGEGIGPFKSFDFDFSDGNGKPHPGPHIFAGVNGSGKSTILRTLAWLVASKSSDSIPDGFQWKEWEHLTQGYTVSRAIAVIAAADGKVHKLPRTTDITKGWESRLDQWVRTLLPTSERVPPGSVELSFPGLSKTDYLYSPQNWSEIRASWSEIRRLLDVSMSAQTETLKEKPKKTIEFLTAAYGPSLLLKHLPQVNLSVQIEHFKKNALSFQATVQNEEIQSWLLNLYSKRAIAKERGQDLSKYSKSLERFENALTLICGQDIEFTVDIEPSLQPRLLMYEKRLDFSQLPDGVRSMVGWLADFLMRMDAYDQWVAKESERIDETGRMLLLDEIDTHLHPQWQRRILPSIKQALPDVQVFATTHSPFVIASCSSARIHVLEVDDNGVARNRPAIDAPVCESILATIKDIFGVSSRFDIETEKLLDEWNELDRGQAVGSLSSKEEQRMAELTENLSSKSKTLKQIVSPKVSIDDSLLASLKSQAQKAESPRKRKAKRG
jgi:energy-coupling factor transporter ATP-binding protein EcfA2